MAEPEEPCPRPDPELTVSAPLQIPPEETVKDEPVDRGKDLENGLDTVAGAAEPTAEALPVIEAEKGGFVRELVRPVATKAAKEEWEGPLAKLVEFEANERTRKAVSAAWHRRVDALVLSSPALDPGMNAGQKLLLAVLGRLAPGLAVGNGLKPEWISRDPAVVAAYVADPLVHDRVTPRLARFILDGGAVVRSVAARWAAPTLLLWAGSDDTHDVNTGVRAAIASSTGSPNPSYSDGYTHA